MKNRLITVIFSLGCNFLFAQEDLVVNGSFEDIFSCPATLMSPRYTSIQYAIGWKNPSFGGALTLFSTPDLFNVCSEQPLSVPLSWQGYQYPDSGNCFAGIGLGGPSEFGYNREFIQTRLVKPIIQGKKYRLSFSLVYGEDACYRCNYLGFAFSSDSISIPDSQSYVNENYFPGLNSDEIIVFDDVLSADTLTWIHFSKDFIAPLNASFMTIGNFKSHNSTAYEFGWVSFDGGVSDYSYGLLDNISLVCYDTVNCDSATGINDLNLKPSLIIFPNPAKEYITIQSKLIKSGTNLSVADLYGRQLKTIDLTENGQYILNTEEFNSGVYLLRLMEKNGEMLQSKFAVVR